MSDTHLRIRLRHPLWVHGSLFESPQLAKQETYEDLIAAADLIDRLTAERDGLKQIKDDAMQTMHDAVDHMKVVSADNERLRKALEPFADVAGEGTEDYGDTLPVQVTMGRSIYYSLTLGDFRRARAALSPSSDTEPKP